MRAIGKDLAALVLPLSCAGCHRWDVAVCGGCRAMWQHGLRRCEEDTVYLAPAEHAAGPGLPVWALAPYQGRVRTMVLRWKSHTRTDLHSFFGAVGTAAGAALAPILAASLPEGSAGPELMVLPAPSGWRRRLRRQFVVGALAQAVSAGLDAALDDGRGSGVRMRDVLRTPGTTMHRLGAADRRAARRVTLTKPGQVLDPRTPVLLVDDVVTTGATLAACAAVLRERGFAVLGALVLAATPGPGSRIWQ